MHAEVRPTFTVTSIQYTLELLSVTKELSGLAQIAETHKQDFKKFRTQARKSMKQYHKSVRSTNARSDELKEQLLKIAKWLGVDLGAE